MSDAVKNKNCDSTITIKRTSGRHFPTTKYYLGGKEITSSTAEKRINLFESSALEMKKRNKLYKISGLTVISAVLLLVGSQIYYNNIHHTGNQQYHSLQNTQIGITLGGIVLALGTGIPARIHLKHSVSLYNREMCNH